MGRITAVVEFDTGKTFKGLTDEMLAWQTEELLSIERTRDGHVVFVEPKSYTRSPSTESSEVLATQEVLPCALPVCERPP